jgi:hypothetical protein
MVNRIISHLRELARASVLGVWYASQQPMLELTLWTAPADQ